MRIVFGLSSSFFVISSRDDSCRQLAGALGHVDELANQLGENCFNFYDYEDVVLMVPKATS